MGTPIKVDITEEAGGESVTISIGGEIDLSSVPGLAEQVDAQVGGDHTSLTLDLSDVTFMDSSGLRMLIELNQRAQREAWNLSLIPSQHESAKLILRMTGADTALPFVRQ